MDRNAAVALVKQGMAFRTSLDNEIVAHLQNAQVELEKGITLPWFLLEEDATIAVAVGNRSYALPTGFLRLDEDNPLHFTDVNGEIKFLVKKPFGEALAFYSGYAPDKPLAYSIRKSTFYLSPSPSTALTLTYSYFKADTVLSSGTTENGWLLHFPYLLIGEAGLKLTAGTRDAVGQKFFAGMAQRERIRLSTVIADREQQDMPFALGRNR